MLILGINAFHGDSAACLMRDGELVAAAEKSASAGSSTGPAFRAKPSAIA